MPTAAKVKNLKEPGKYADRDGLYLNITTRGNKSWVYRYQLNGKRREMGLGSFKNQTLADARDLAYQARQLHKKGIDPKEQRDQDKAHSSTMTFEECAKAYIKSHEAGWKNEKHISQWKSTLKQYAYLWVANCYFARNKQTNDRPCVR
ncbi:MAG: DUF4102 domain-containing protein [Gammaproteobacteria bacterium]|nr:DUF4102 domain-containing protein [Gammaproteobacteria bacterium]